MATNGESKYVIENFYTYHGSNNQEVCTIGIHLTNADPSLLEFVDIMANLKGDFTSTRTDKTINYKQEGKYISVTVVSRICKTLFQTGLMTKIDEKTFSFISLIGNAKKLIFYTDPNEERIDFTFDLKRKTHRIWSHLFTITFLRRMSPVRERGVGSRGSSEHRQSREKMGN